MTDKEKKAKVELLLVVANEHGLVGSGWAAALGTDELARCYNGIGPEWFPEALREFVNGLCPEFEPCAMIHDAMWSHAEGTRARFRTSNTALRINCLVMADDSCAWYNPRRYILRHRAHLFADLCDKLGWEAYLKACGQKGEVK